MANSNDVVMRMQINRRGKKELGVVFTPDEVVSFMLSLLQVREEGLDILEPACSDAPFLKGIQQLFGNNHSLLGVEIDPEVKERFVLNKAELLIQDFLLWETHQRFDLIIGNPPYGIIGNKSHYPIHALLHVKSHYKQIFRTWHGKYNIYGAFIEKSVELLKPGGTLCFVIPATWLLLDDFKRLRKYLSEQGTFSIHYVGRVFANVNVVAVVLHFKKMSPGVIKLYVGRTLHTTYTEYDGDMISFQTKSTLSFEKNCGQRLGELFNIYFAARSPEVKKNPYVFSEWKKGRSVLLTGRNLKVGEINYEKNYSGFWVEHDQVSSLRSFYASPHIVVGHTKGAKVIAAFDDRCYAWREEFHLVPKRKINEQMVVRYLNSPEVQAYVATKFRDMIPHLTKSQLSRLPIPHWD